MLEWAKNNGIAVRGHTIIWHSQTPQWIFHEGFDTSKPKVDRDTMLKRMESYIKQVFEQLETLGYLDIIYAYDVVNEAVMEDGSLRDSSWKQVIGDDFIWYAFYYADKYAPESVKLFYNDYNEQFKTDYIVDLAKSLVDDNGKSLIDGIGCQAHLYTQDDIDAYMKTLEAFSALGLDVQLTELDVSLGTWTNKLLPTKDNLKVQGQYYYELINRIAEGNAAGTTCVSAITFWGISDANSWRSDRSPLLFDRMFLPKNAYFGAVQDREHAGY
jgi:endo-1,4-beta-xylanase